jgi:hypothetical protein
MPTKFLDSTEGDVSGQIEISSAASLFMAAVVCYGLGIYLFNVMNREVYDQLPESGSSWLKGLVSHSISLHREYYPESRLRMIFYFCGIGSVACGVLGFFIWTK